MVKIFRNMDTKALSAEVSAFYNRAGRIGNHPGNAKLHLFANGEVGVTVPYWENKVDDGRQIDDIEDRKHIFIAKISGTDDTEINQFLRDHKDGFNVSQPYIEAIGDELLVFIAATKIVLVDDEWDDDEDDDEDGNDETTGDDAVVDNTASVAPVTASVPVPPVPSVPTAPTADASANNDAPAPADDEVPWFN